MRYRLYEIDRLINATLVYGALTVLLAAAFVAVTLSRERCRDRRRLGAVPTAAATLAVTLTFRPLRARVQTLVDRRFNRARYEGLQHGGSLPRRSARRTGGAGAGGSRAFEALGDPRLELFFWLPDGTASRSDRACGRASCRRWARRTPCVAASCSSQASFPTRRSVTPGPARAGDLRGRAGDRDRPAAGRGAPAALRGRGVARPASSRRVEERRRLERDLHDGAQQRLVSIGLGLRHVQTSGELPPGPTQGDDPGFGGRRGLARGDRGVARAGPRRPARRPR